MNLEERIVKAEADIESYRQQIEQIEKQSAMMKSRYDALILAMHQAVGSLEALKEIQASEIHIEEEK